MKQDTKQAAREALERSLDRAREMNYREARLEAEAATRLLRIEEERQE